MKTFLSAILFLSPLLSTAQYWYNDVWNNNQTTALIATYQKAGVTAVKVAAYDANNVRTDDVGIQQAFSAASRTLITRTASAANGLSWLTVRWNTQGQVVQATDSTASNKNVTDYRYDGEGRLTQLLITGTDSAGVNAQTDEHLWQYEGSTPLRMLRIKNKKDTTVVQLKTDEEGRVIEELLQIKNRPAEAVYYYYDAQGRLTDVVRYNRRARRLLPETMYEWGAGAQPLQRISVPPTGTDYLIWRYQYDQNGLKLREAIYNKQKQLTGKVEYQYSYNK